MNDSGYMRRRKMKIIGMIGGMSWESTLEYYRIVNEETKGRLGGFHSAKCILYSVDFAEIEKLQHESKWKEATALMVEAARRVERGGAEFIIICTNTMHLMADAVQSSIGIPLLHIVDATAEEIKRKQFDRVGLLGTRFTMEHHFYRNRLSEEHGIEAIIPPEEYRKIIHDILYNELCLGEIKNRSKEKFRKIIEDLVDRGAQGIILGCTEIPLLVNQKDYSIPLFDTTLIHSKAAVEYALS
jgi:aspartate racemase